MRTKYRGIIAQVLKRIRDYYRERQEKELQYLEAKKLLLEQAQKITAEEYSNSKAWQKATETIQNVFEEWKKIGYAPKKDEDKMRNELRTSLNLFYKKKRTHFASLKKTFKENKEKKLALIKEAEAISSAQYELWEEPTKKVLQLQKDWQTTGHVEQRDESKLWKLFHDSCNKFFEAKRGSFKERDDEQLKNLELKKDLIKRLKEFTPSANTDDDIKALKTFSEEWKSISHVPYKEMQRVYDEYKKTLDAKYDALKMDGSKKHMLKFKNNIDLLSQGGNPDEMLRKEKQFIKDKIGKLNTTISQYENNLGFFRNSKNMGSLLKDAEENLAKAKEEVELLNKKLKMISDAAREPVGAK
jgi:hypothetical protein